MGTQARAMMRTRLFAAGAMIMMGGLLGVGIAGAAETFTIDSVHSSVGFKIRHLFSHVSGRFSDFDGTLKYDAEQPEKSSIELVIQAESIDTDNQRRDDHLRSEDFFHVAEHPTITFKSTKIVPGEKPNRYRVTGDFTMRGVTKPVTIDVEMLGFAEIPGMGYRGGFDASTTLDRKDYGVEWNKVLDTGGAILGDEVAIDCSIQVVRS